MQSPVKSLIHTSSGFLAASNALVRPRRTSKLTFLETCHVKQQSMSEHSTISGKEKFDRGI